MVQVAVVVAQCPWQIVAGAATRSRELGGPRVCELGSELALRVVAPGYSRPGHMGAMSPMALWAGQEAQGDVGAGGSCWNN